MNGGEIFRNLTKFNHALKLLVYKQYFYQDWIYRANKKESAI